MVKSRSNYHSGRLEGKCYFCESGPPLEEHHIIPQRFGGEDTKDNVVELCQLCHQRLERLYDKSFYEWFGISDEQGERKFFRQCEVSECNNRAKLRVNWNITIEHNDVVQLSSVQKPVDWCLDDFPVRNRLVCRPCAAKKAREIVNEGEAKYHKSLSRWQKGYEEEREKVHERARRLRRGELEGGVPAPPDLDKPEKPEKPEYSAQEILNRMTLEEADD